MNGRVIYMQSSSLPLALTLAATLLMILYTLAWIPAILGEWILFASLAIAWLGGMTYTIKAIRGRARSGDTLVYSLLLLAVGAYTRAWAGWYSYSLLPPTIYATGFAAAVTSIPHGRHRAGVSLAAILAVLTAYTFYMHHLYRTSMGYDFGLDTLADIILALGAGLGYAAYQIRTGSRGSGILLAALIMAPPLVDLHLVRASLLFESLLLLAFLALGASTSWDRSTSLKLGGRVGM